MTNTPTPIRSRAPGPASTRNIRSTAVREAATFLGLVTLMALTIALALPRTEIAVKLTMPTPLIAVILMTFFRTPRGRRKELWASLGLKRLGLRSWPVAFAVSLTMVLVIPYGVAAWLGSVSLVPLNSSADAWLNISINLFMGLVVTTFFALTEEIGWRGFLLPRVQTMVSKRWAALIVGFIHGLFHMPLVLLTTTYNSVGDRWIVAPSVMVLITAAGAFYAWLYDRSGSVWPVAFAHSTVNVFLGGGGLIVIVSPLALAYTAGESGLATAASVIGTAVILLIWGRTWGAARTAHSTPAEQSA